MRLIDLVTSVCWSLFNNILVLLLKYIALDCLSSQLIICRCLGGVVPKKANF